MDAVSNKIDLAKKKIELLRKDVCSLMELHEGNKIVNYSNLITKQVPTSHAAWALEIMRDAMMQNEIIGVCRIWDKAEDTNSIPAITKLISETEVQKTLTEICIEQWPNETSFANANCSKILERLKSAIETVNSTITGNIHLRTQNLRNKYLAHLVTETREEKKRMGPIPSAQYGDERLLLESAVQIVESFYLGVNGISFSMADHKAMYKRRAEAFWHGVTIKVLK